MQFLTQMCSKRKKIYNTLMKTNGDTRGKNSGSFINCVHTRKNEKLQKIMIVANPLKSLKDTFVRMLLILGSLYSLSYCDCTVLSSLT